MANDQLEAQFFSMYLFKLSTCFEQTSCSSSGESIVSVQHLVYVTLSRWPFLVLHTKRLPTQSDVYQMLYWYNWFSWRWARGCSKLVKDWNKYIEKNCTSSWSFAMNHNRMHGQQNTRVGTLILATIYLQLIQNRYMFRSFTVLQCSHQHCVQTVASDVEVVGYL